MTGTQQMTAFSQLDPAWSNKLVVTNTIGRIGCTITSLAMLTSLTDYPVSPVDVVKQVRFTDANHPVSANLIIWESITNLQAVTGFERIRGNSHEIYVKVQQALSDGHGALLEVNGGAHWVACNQWGGGFDCIDPWGGKPRVVAWTEPTGFCIVYLNKKKVITAPTPPPSQVPVVANGARSMIAQNGDGISHLLKRAGRADYAEEKAWNEVAFANGVDHYSKLRIFAGQSYIIPANAPQVQPASTPVVEPVQVVQPVPVRIVQPVEEVDNTTSFSDEITETPQVEDINVPTIKTMPKYDINQVMIDFARLNADKATYVASIVVLLTQFNDILQLGVANEQITTLGGIIATVLILAGVVRQLINKMQK